MFTDDRSKSIIFVAHCILNQNSISDGTATFPGSIKEVVEFLSKADVGVSQMPCPELMCLGLDRGNIAGGTCPVVEENTRIRRMINRKPAANIISKLIEGVIFQIIEYKKYGFEIKGVVGINRSPSCGVETTSANNREVEGEGVFIRALRNELKRNDIQLKFVGIKAFEIEKAIETMKDLIGSN